MRMITALTILWLGFSGLTVHGAEPQFKVAADRNEVSLDASVTLKFSITTEDNSQIGEAQFLAPDFEVINQYQSSQIQSYYEEDRFGVRKEQNFTYILKPLKTGSFKISKIQTEIGGKIYSAGDITIQVVSSGSARQNQPSGRGGAPSAGGKAQPAGNTFFVRAEVSKTSAVKAEQIIVSYYVYRKVRIFNLQVEKYPVLNGFLREDLELPVMSGRLDTERVMIGSTPYERSLLVRYAAYPLQDGKLTIDSITVKANYYGGNSRGFDEDEDDPFAHFFRQMAPQIAESKSDPVNLEVAALPETGKPATFTGGVGDFTLKAETDKAEIRANEILTVRVHVEGRGNMASIEAPKLKLPPNVDTYDASSRVKAGRGTTGEKIFEILILPRQQGRLEIPPVEMSFYDPLKRSYVTRSTHPLAVNVLEGAPGSAPPPPRATPQTGQAEQAPTPLPKPMDLRDMLRLVWTPLTRTLLQFLAGSAVLMFILIRIRRSLRSWRAKRKAVAEKRKDWKGLIRDAKRALTTDDWNLAVQIYETIAQYIFDLLDEKYAINSRPWPREELRRILVEEKGMKEELWGRIVVIFEHVEAVRFASAIGVVTKDQAKAQCEKWIVAGETIDQELKKK